MEELINKRIILLLRQFGLKDQEIDAYLMLLKDGECSVPKLAKKLKTSKSSVYYFVDKLKDSGFVCEKIKGNSTIITIDNPQKLQFLMEEQEMKFKMRKLNINNFLIPTLEKLSVSREKAIKSKDSLVDVKFYKGKTGVRRGLLEIFTEDLSWLGMFVSFQRQSMFLPEFFLNNFYLKLCEMNFIKKVLISEAERSFILEFSDKYLKNNSKIESFEVKQMPVLNIPEDIYVFKNRVLFVNLDVRNSYAILISDKALSMTLRGLFKVVWEVSEI